MTKVSYKKFMTEVRNHLASLSEQELKDLILSWAEQTAHGERDSFLRAFSCSKQKDTVLSLDREEVLSALEAFAERVKSSEYCQGWGWDDDYEEERDWGDETWALEMDRFFAYANSFQQNCDHVTAKEIYLCLFELLELGDEPGYLPGDHLVSNMLDADLVEELARLLRSVYLTNSLNELSPVFYDLIHRYGGYSRNFNLEIVLEVSEEPLPDLNIFLPLWIEFLAEQEGRFASRLYREAIKLQGGESALWEFARKKALSEPEAYLELLQLLSDQGKNEQIREVAKEALEKIPRDFLVRGKIAEFLIEEAQRLGDENLQLFALEEIFSSDPSLLHLLDLLATASQLEQSAQISTKVLERIKTIPDSNEAGLVSKHSRQVKVALFHTLILSGNYGELFALCVDEDALGWSYGDNPRPLLVLVLFRLLSRGGKRHFVLDKLWQRVLPYEAWGQEEIVEKYNHLFEQVYSGLVISETEEKEYLKWCAEQVQERVQAIVEGKYRKSYHKAADFIVALAETQNNLGHQGQSLNPVDHYQRLYPRHSALRREIRRSWAESRANA